MTRKEFIKKYDTEIRTIALHANVDMGIAADTFTMSAMIGRVATGNEPELVEGLRLVGDDAYFKGLQAEYLGVEDVEFPNNVEG